jgi:Beta/Gamma crystallin
MPGHADDVEHAGGAPGVTLYSFPNYSGRRVVINRDTPKLKKLNFATTAMSMKVSGGRWEVCENNQYNGACEVFGPGQYTFGVFNWGNKIKSVRRVRSGTPTITLYSKENMQGQKHTYAGSMPRIKDFAINDFAQSVKINGGEWVLCENSGGKGKCETVRNNITALRSIGLGGAISSLYPASEWQTSDLDGGGYGGAGYGSGGSGYGSNDERYYNNGNRRGNARYPQLVLFEGYGFTGQRMTLDRESADLRDTYFSNRASSVRITAGAWELCDGAEFTKTCRVVDRDVDNLADIGLDSLITSVRPIANRNRNGGEGRNGRRTDRNGYEGQRTVFFAEPAVRGEPVANCLYGNTQCGAPAANAYCRSVGLGRAVYFDKAQSYRAPYLLGERRITRRPGQQRLIDVLCSR